MLKYRIATAVIGIPFLILLIYLGSIPLACTTATMYLIGIYEYIRLVKKAGYSPFAVSMYLGGFLIVLGSLVHNRSNPEFFILLVVFLIVFEWLSRKQHLEISDLAVSLMGVLYLILLMYINLLRELPNGFFFMVLILILIWTTDTGAYIVGKKFGKNKLASKISPNKTLEGAVGGIAQAILVAIIISSFTAIRTFDAIALGIIISIVGQIGDLFESSLKRKANSKDSGKLLPGHGGFLDRFDSMIFAAPAAYYYIVFFILP